jgi:hypothetical protein
MAVGDAVLVGERVAFVAVARADRDDLMVG